MSDAVYTDVYDKELCYDLRSKYCNRIRFNLKRITIYKGFVVASGVLFSLVTLKDKGKIYL